jgi:transposase
VKLLYWDETGMALWWKGLENEKFRWPKKDDNTWNIEVKELRWLLEGVDLTKIKKHQKLEYD